jgi:hypothetical protein
MNILIIFIVASMLFSCTAKVPPCHSDYIRYCGLEKTGTPGFKKCKAANKGKFSDACRQHLEKGNKK